MADSILAASVGANPIYFPLMPNWGSLPKVNYSIVRDFVGYPGTPQNMSIVTDRSPVDFTIQFMVDNKDDEYELLDWLHTVKGRHKAFWIEHPVHLFTLEETVASGASSLKVSPNQYERVGQGDERIFIAMKNGDIIVRTITGSDYDFQTDELLLTLSNPTDRQITTEDYWVIGRFLLCRLKRDSFRQTIQSSNITTYSAGFYEVPFEYSETAHGA